MTAAVLAALAAWCAVPSSSRPRARRLFVAPAASTRADPALLAAVLVPVAAIVLLGVVGGLVAGAALGPLAHRAVGRLETSASRRRTARLAADLPGALDLVVAALLAGRPAVTAFAVVAEATDEPLRSELAVLAGRLAIAADPDTVWDGVAEHPALAPVGRAFRRASVSGMPVAEIVGAVADELRRERGAGLRERSQRAGVRTAAPLGLCFLPAFFLIGIVPAVVASFGSLSW